MSSSLLSLPDELLAHIVDEALSEYAPRLYKQRQDTARALCLVNKRIGAMAQGKIVEAVHQRWAFEKDQPTFLCSPQMHSRTRHLLVKYPRITEYPLSPTFLPPFGALRDLCLVQVYDIQLEQITQLPELRDLVLFRAGYSASIPLAAPKLARLALFFCDEDIRMTEPSRLLGTGGCPSLRYLYLGRRNGHDSVLSTRNLVGHLDNVVLELVDELGLTASWTRTDLDAAAADKTLFDCAYHELPLLRDGIEEPRHVRVYEDEGWAEDDGDWTSWHDFADCLPAAFPNLCTLYFPRALDTANVAHGCAVIKAVRALKEACSAAQVEVIFEHDRGVMHDGQLRESPHFAARCRRVKAEHSSAEASYVARSSA